MQVDGGCHRSRGCRPDEGPARSANFRLSTVRGRPVGLIDLTDLIGLVPSDLED